MRQNPVYFSYLSFYFVDGRDGHENGSIGKNSYYTLLNGSSHSVRCQKIQVVFMHPKASLTQPASTDARHNLHTNNLLTRVPLGGPLSMWYTCTCTTPDIYKFV